MSEQGQVFVNSGESVGVTAGRVAEVLGARRAPRLPPGQGQNPDAVYLLRESTEPGFTVTIEVAANEYAEHPPAADDVVYVHFAVACEVWVTGGGRRAPADVLHRETGRVFDDIVAGTDWPAVHASVGGAVHSAWSPALGRTDFPPGTPFDGAGRAWWGRYA